MDAVDLVCREHDRCYGLLGHFDERCDRNLVEMMPNAITPSPLGKQVGILTLLHFSLAERNLGLGETLFRGDRGGPSRMPTSSETRKTRG